METLQCIALATLVFVLISYIAISPFRQPSKTNLPPSPPRRPIIGHLHLLYRPLHKSIDSLFKQHGPIIHLSFGSRPVVLVSSPSAVEECFTKKDIVFLNRPRLLSAKHLNYNYTTITSSPHGEHWRNLRRLTSAEIFSTSGLVSSASTRFEEAHVLIKQMVNKWRRDHDKSDDQFVKVEFKSVFSKVGFNIVMRMLGVKPCFEAEEMLEAEKGGKRLEDLMKRFHPQESFALGDFFPFLWWLDRWFVVKKMIKLHQNRDVFIERLIEERRESMCSSGVTKEGEKGAAIIDVLLCLQRADPDYYTDDIIKGIVLIMFTAGTAALALFIEWAMALLLNNPHALTKTRDEIDSNIGRNRLLTESDLVKLPYLRNVINETLRLCNFAPILVPREASEDCTIGGYNISRGTMLLVNILAVHKDPNEWSEPTVFKPERFEGEGCERSGANWLPFGMGRRKCVGEGLALKTLGLIVGSMVQCFEWERVGEELVDMSVGMGSGFMAKAQPLEALYRPRDSLLEVFNEI
ncbi:hypothetical protein Sjap_022767 [Stephania japonica]|uniref:Cytochrome P450 n=1 Tax=Stephania japonica TaxID=461633 RepID=A0AAP0EPH2_9MAGN